MLGLDVNELSVDQLLEYGFVEEVEVGDDSLGGFRRVHWGGLYRVPDQLSDSKKEEVYHRLKAGEDNYLTGASLEAES